MISVARYLTETLWPGRVHLILGFQAPHDFIFREVIAELQSRNANLSVTVTLSRPGDEPCSGAVGHTDAALLTSAVPDIATRRTHIWGPPQMMDAVKTALFGLGVPDVKIKRRPSAPSNAIPWPRALHRLKSQGKVVFQASDTTALVPVDATILDAGDEAGVFIDNACRSGTCGSCHVKLISGSVRMAVDDALTEQDKAEGYILTCQAKIRGEVKVDA